MGLAAAGCAKAKAPASARPPSAQPRHGGVLIHAGGLAGDLDTVDGSIDPHTATAPAGKSFRLVYQGLLGYDPDTYEVQPELAQKWEQSSPTEYVFTLQPNVKWQNKPPANGRELSAADIVFSLQRARTPDPRFLSASLLASIDKVEAVDKGTVRITTKAPDVTILDKLSSDTMLTLAPEVVDKAGKFSTADSVVGTGPFILQSVEVGVGSEYSSNPDYWRPGRPYLDGVRTSSFSDDEIADAAGRAGKVDVWNVPGHNVGEYVKRQGPNFSPPWWRNDGGLEAVANTKRTPMDDPRVPRALRLLFDWQELKTAYSEVWYGRGQNGSVFPPALSPWDLTEAEYSKLLDWQQPKDEAVSQALALLSAAGFTSANPLKFELASSTTSFTQALAQLVQAQWKRLGQGVVASDLKLYDLATFTTVRSNRSFTYFVGGGSASVVEPDAWLKEIYATGGSRNYSGFSDAKLDAMVEQQRTEFDASKRKQSVREIVLYLIDHSPSILLDHSSTLNGLSARVQGFRAEGTRLNGRQYDAVWLGA
jgi:peptide/nickel transport system substrate-binding protein